MASRFSGQVALRASGILGLSKTPGASKILMLNTICLTSLHNIQQDLINFIPVFPHCWCRWFSFCFWNKLYRIPKHAISARALFTYRQKHNQIGIVCFTFSKIKKFSKSIIFGIDCLSDISDISSKRDFDWIFSIFKILSFYHDKGQRATDTTI